MRLSMEESNHDFIFFLVYFQGKNKKFACFADLPGVLFCPILSPDTTAFLKKFFMNGTPSFQRGGNPPAFPPPTGSTLAEGKRVDWNKQRFSLSAPLSARRPTTGVFMDIRFQNASGGAWSADCIVIFAFEKDSPAESMPALW